MAENKVRFGLKKVHYAILTEGATNSWATPVAVPGAVSLTLDANVTSNEFFADNVTYYKSFANNGYTGTLEMARIPDQMLKDIWGEVEENTNKVLFEKSGIQPKPFALLFEIDGDADEELNVLYRVIPSTKPTAGSQTTEESADPVTQSFELSALPLVTGAAAQLNTIKARTTHATPAATKTGWFSSVVVPTAAAN